MRLGIGRHFNKPIYKPDARLNDCKPKQSTEMGCLFVSACVRLQETLCFDIMICIGLLLLFSSYVSTTY